MRGRQGGKPDCARINLEAHHAFELDKLTIFKEWSCANLRSRHGSSVGSFFDRLTLSWEAVVNDSIIALGTFPGEDGADVFGQEQKDRYRLILDTEKARVYNHLGDSVGRS